MSMTCMSTTSIQSCMVGDGLGEPVLTEHPLISSLHGTWDSNNPIGNNVLGHTNLTEIKLALDLLWRNKVDPGKLNLGIGFYGRSFQLSDPACFRPGCKFLGGAAPGAVSFPLLPSRSVCLQ